MVKTPLDPFGRSPEAQELNLAAYARLVTNTRLVARNIAQEVFDDAARLGATRGTGSAAARLFAKIVPHVQTRNALERSLIASLLAAPLPLGVEPAPLFLSPALRAPPGSRASGALVSPGSPQKGSPGGLSRGIDSKTRQAVYRLYKGGALDVAVVQNGRVRVEAFLVVARPRKLTYRLTWGAGPFGRLD